MLQVAMSYRERRREDRGGEWGHTERDDAHSLKKAVAYEQKTSEITSAFCRYPCALRDDRDDDHTHAG